MTTIEWFHSQVNRLNDLRDFSEKRDLLSQIKIKFLGLNSKESGEVSHNINYQRIFLELSGNNSDYVEEVCDLIRALLEGSETGDIYRRYPADIIKLISAENWMVRAVFLQEVLRTTSSASKTRMLLRDKTLIVAVVERIGDENLTVAKLAMSIVKKLGSTARGVRILFTGNCFSTLCQLLTINDTISFRVYETVVHIAKVTKEGFRGAAHCGFLHSLLRYVDSEDVLVQLNTIEILRQFIIADDGLMYLEQHNVVNKLVQLLDRARTNSFSTLVLPGLLKFFGSVGIFWPKELFLKYPMVVTAVFEILESRDPTLLGAALDSLGHMASSTESKYSLYALGNYMPCALMKISEVLHTMASDLKIRALNCLALILDVRKTDHDNRILSLTKLWFDSLCHNPLEVIFTLCKQPFCDIRHAALEVLVVLASQVWGQEYIAADPELIEFILDRRSEKYKECKEARYEIVEHLSEAESNIFDPDTLQRFKDYVNDGPHSLSLLRQFATEGVI